MTPRTTARINFRTFEQKIVCNGPTISTMSTLESSFTIACADSALVRRCSVRLRTSLPSQVIPHHQPIQRLHQHRLRSRPLSNICRTVAIPLFYRGEPRQVLMGSHMVVKQRELLKRALQCRLRWNHKLAQQRFERAKQTLYAPVLPRRTSLYTLVPNAYQLQKCGEHKTGEDALVVGAQCCCPLVQA
jgi:hypothetical protein